MSKSFLLLFQLLPAPPPPLGNTLDRQAMQKNSLTGSLSSSQKQSIAGINSSSMTKSFINYEPTPSTRLSHGNILSHTVPQTMENGHIKHEGIQIQRTSIAEQVRQ